MGLWSRIIVIILVWWIAWALLTATALYFKKKEFSEFTKSMMAMPLVPVIIAICCVLIPVGVLCSVVKSFLAWIRLVVTGYSGTHIDKIHKLQEEIYEEKGEEFDDNCN